MANRTHLALIGRALMNQDISIWNQWRIENPDVEPDLSATRLSRTNLSRAYLYKTNLSRTNLVRANLTETNLIGANLNETNLSWANLSKAQLTEANLNQAVMRGANLSMINLRGADLQEADLVGANLSFADLREANLSRAVMQTADLSYTILYDASLIGADLGRANLYQTNLWQANLYGANLTEATLRETNLANATLEGCIIGGNVMWNIKLEGTVQKDLNISPYGQSPITVDNLKVAQFIYLLLNNAEIRDVIDTITSKAVLILGRFAPERKVVLDAMREDLRSRGFLPILFDFEKPSSRDLTETVVTLAHLSRFVIADLTNPSSIPHELMSFTRDLPSVPVQPIILKGQRPYAMFLDHLGRYQHVLECYEYESQETLIAELAEKVIQPAQNKAEAMKPKLF